MPQYVIIYTKQFGAPQAIGPFSDEKAYRLRTKLWEQALENNTTVGVQIVQHTTEEEVLGA